MSHNVTIREAYMEQQEVNRAPSPLMQNHIVHAAWMNQQGASFLLDGNIERAAQWFSGALQLVRFQLPSHVGRPFPVASVPPRSDAMPRVDESRGFVYWKPLFFNPEAVITDEDLMSYVAVITFNLGLAHQLEGHVLGDGGDFLVTAKALYEVTLDLLSRQLRYDCSNIIIASLNNLACVNAELCMFEDAHQTLLLMAVNIKEGRVRTDTIHGDDFSDVILNIRILTMPVCAAEA